MRREFKIDANQCRRSYKIQVFRSIWGVQPIMGGSGEILESNMIVDSGWPCCVSERSFQLMRNKNEVWVCLFPLKYCSNKGTKALVHWFSNIYIYFSICIFRYIYISIYIFQYIFKYIYFSNIYIHIYFQMYTYIYLKISELELHIHIYGYIYTYYSEKAMAPQSSCLKNPMGGGAR